MKSTTIAIAMISSLLAVAACDKKEATATTTTTTATGAAAATAAATPTADIKCDTVVEKIASLNPPDSRGEPEKKLWGKMCAEMTPENKTCVMAAKDMDGMKECMKHKTLQR